MLRWQRQSNDERIGMAANNLAIEDLARNRQGFVFRHPRVARGALRCQSFGTPSFERESENEIDST